MTAEELDKNFESMIPSFKWEVLSDEVSTKLNVEVTEDDLNQRAFDIARQQLMQYGMYNMDNDTIADMGRRLLADKKLRQQIHGQCEESKMFYAVSQAVTLDEKTVSLDEFKKLVEAPAAE
jgi:trigger factor